MKLLFCKPNKNMRYIGSRNILRLFTLSTLLVVLVINGGMAKPVQRTEQKREKRSGISDQRLAELETLLELKKLRESLRTRTPVAYGLFDPEKIGKRRKREHYFRFDRTDSIESHRSTETSNNEPIFVKTLDYQN